MIVFVAVSFNVRQGNHNELRDSFPGSHQQASTQSNVMQLFRFAAANETVAVFLCQLTQQIISSAIFRSIDCHRQSTL